jgi:uncharacterized membrane protein
MNSAFARVIFNIGLAHYEKGILLIEKEGTAARTIAKLTGYLRQWQNFKKSLPIKATIRADVWVGEL